MYECEFPNCNFKSSDRGLFDNHHIIAKSAGGSDKNFNRILLCPNCHRKIFIDNVKGIHSRMKSESIIILGKIQSSAGIALNYIKCSNNKEYYWFPKTHEDSIVED